MTIAKIQAMKSHVQNSKIAKLTFKSDFSKL